MNLMIHSFGFSFVVKAGVKDHLESERNAEVAFFASMI
jgi:hypothetical protein